MGKPILNVRNQNHRRKKILCLTTEENGKGGDGKRKAKRFKGEDFGRKVELNDRGITR